MGEGRAHWKQMTTISIFLHFVNFIVYRIILAIRRSRYREQFFVSEENEIYLLMHRLNRFFGNMVNFIGFLFIHVSQGSVTTYVRCGGMSTVHCTANFLLSLAVKEFLKSVKI